MKKASKIKKSKKKVSSIIKDDNEKRLAVCENSGDDELLFYDGCDKAIIGHAGRCGMDSVVVYDYDKLIECFMKQGMTDEEAVEWIDYNVTGGYIGEKTPLVFHDMNRYY